MGNVLGGPLLGCEKYIKNASEHAVPVPVEEYQIKLIEQTVLLLDQAPNSILYIRSLQI